MKKVADVLTEANLVPADADLTIRVYVPLPEATHDYVTVARTGYGSVSAPTHVAVFVLGTTMYEVPLYVDEASIELWDGRHTLAPFAVGTSTAPQA